MEGREKRRAKRNGGRAIKRWCGRKKEKVEGGEKGEEK